MSNSPRPRARSRPLAPLGACSRLDLWCCIQVAPWVQGHTACLCCHPNMAPFSCTHLSNAPSLCMPLASRCCMPPAQHCCMLMPLLTSQSSVLLPKCGSRQPRGSNFVPPPSGVEFWLVCGARGIRCYEPTLPIVHWIAGRPDAMVLQAKSSL